jgi:hypothetical protein
MVTPKVDETYDFDGRDHLFLCPVAAVHSWLEYKYAAIKRRADYWNPSRIIMTRDFVTRDLETFDITPFDILVVHLPSNPIEGVKVCFNNEAKDAFVRCRADIGRVELSAGHTLRSTVLWQGVVNTAFMAACYAIVHLGQFLVTTTFVSLS